MALDAATFSLCAKEIKEILIDARIDKIFQPAKEEVLFLMRNRKESFTLLLSARSGLARLCITEEKYENPQMPPTFCMLLRKHLIGGKLKDVRAVPNERIVFLDFLCTNEMGDLVDNTIALELMGRYCNIVLINNGVRDRNGSVAGESPCKVIDALKRIDFEDSEIRQLLPGLKYVLPQPRVGLGFIDASHEEIKNALNKQDGFVLDALKKMFTGVGPVIVRELYFRAFGKTEKVIEDLSTGDWDALLKAIEDMRADYKAGGRANLVRDKGGKPFEFSFTALTQYEDAEHIFYDGFSKMLEAYYAQKDRQERLRIKSRELRKAVNNMYERAVRKQAARIEEKQESENSEHLRIKGELLTANIHTFKKGDTRVRLQNWYDGSDMDIQLDIRLSPADNAQKFFKEYKKKQTAAKMLAELLEKGENEIKYLETVLYSVDTAEGENALEEIRLELKSQGYLKYYKPKAKKQKAQGFIQYLSSDGFTIYVGRNNLQNEKLTLKTARGKDMWFHTKNAPGSHVIVISEGQDIPLQTQNEAAKLAVWYSSQKNSAQVPIDYTIVKNIRKTGDLPAGMVLYENYETAYVTASEEDVNKIKHVK